MPTRKASAFKPGYMLVHSGKNIPFGYTVADWRIDNIADFPRLYGEIGQAWRDPADVYDTSTQFRVPDGRRYMIGADPIYGALQDGAGSVVAVPVITDAGRTATWTLNGGFNFNLKKSTKTYAAGKHFLAARFNTAGGIAAIASVGIAGAGLDVNDPATIAGNVAVVGSETFAPFDLEAATDQAYIGSNTLAGNQIVIFFFDRDAGTWGSITNDGTVRTNQQALVGLGGNPLGMPAGPVQLVTFVEGMATGANAPLGVTWLTDAELSAAGRSAPAGYANAVGTSYSVGKRQGSNTTAGHALTAAEMAPHTHQYNYKPVGLGGDHGTGIAGGNGTAFVGQETESAADQLLSQAHSHDFQAPQAQYLVLVKI
jgi:hypothetical protein